MDSIVSLSGRFTVTVNGATAPVSELITTIQSFNLPGNNPKGFMNQLQAVQADLSVNNTAQACLDLTGFINHVQAQSGKKLTSSQAAEFVASARKIQAVLAC